MWNSVRPRILARSFVRFFVVMKRFAIGQVEVFRYFYIFCKAHPDFRFCGSGEGKLRVRS
jgi:hypothetical protein